MKEKHKKEKNRGREQLKIEKKLKLITKEIKQLEEQIAEIEVNKTIGKGNKRILDITINKLYKELDGKNEMYKETELELEELPESFVDEFPPNPPKLFILSNIFSKNPSSLVSIRKNSPNERKRAVVIIIFFVR